ncbi:MAG: acetate--CoA ligase family protein [Actinomycetota bacterium]
MGSRGAVRTMLEANSMAIVGASPRKDSFGEMMVLEALRSGYEGTIYPVNPKYDEILGLKAYPSLADVPESVDIALLGVGNHLIEDQLDLAIETGAKSAAIFASCYTSTPAGEPTLLERLTEKARAAELAICGGNCMGFLNVDRKLRVCGFVEPDLEPGPITFISHSGSVFSAMAFNDRDLRFNVIVSAGQEIATTTADYMHYALDQDTTKAIGLFIETIRDPDTFVDALRRAAEKDVPVVALKVGREAKAREMVAAHSGALAGEDGAYEALFSRYGVLRVENLERMCDTLELFTRNDRRAGPGGLASIHDSGGERAMFIDAAAEAGVEFARINAETTRKLEETLEEGLPAVNPLDAWGTGNDAEQIFIDCLKALRDDPDTAGVAFAVDMTYDHGNEEDYTWMAEQVFPESTKPFAMLSNMSSTIHPPDAKRMRDQGIPVLEGTNTGLDAFRHLFAYRDYRALPPVGDPTLPSDEVRQRWRERLSRSEPLPEHAGLALLADYGIPVSPTELASSLDEALAAAGKLGYPVAIKTAATGVMHKSDAGGVKLGLADADAAAVAYEDLADRLGPEVVVAPMAESGVELALGIVHDEQFGPMVLVAAGGILVELLKDRRLALPPLDEVRARGLLDGLRSRPILDGVRGAQPSDIDAVVRSIVAVSVLAFDLGDLIQELDANPVIASPKGCVAVDALVVSRSI